MRLSIALLLLTGCFQRHKPIRTAAKAERQEQPNAEALWVKALSEPLAGVEWRTSHRHLCRLRGERITAVAADLDPATVDAGFIRGLRSQIDHCDKWAETQDQLALLQENHALQRFADVREQADHAQVFEAHPHVRVLSEAAPQRATYAGWLNDYTAHLRALPRNGPASSLLIDTLLREAGEEVELRKADVAAAIEVGDGALSLIPDGTCTAWVKPGSAPASQAAVQATETHVISACSSTTSQHQVDVPYEVKYFRTEMKQVAKTGSRQVNVSERVPTGQNCYQTSEKYQTCITQYSWSTRTRTESYTYFVDEPIQVPYYVTEYRKETRWRRKGSLDVRITTRSPHGMSERTVTVPHQMDGVALVDESTFFTAAADTARPEIRKASRELARTWFVGYLLDHADLSTLDGIENRLLAAHTGTALTPEDRTAIGATLGLPTAALQPNRPMLSDLSVQPLLRDSVADPRPVANDGLLKFGFPLITATLGFGRGTGFDDLPAHRTPRSFQGMFREDFQYASMARTPLGQFGMHVGAYGAAHYGWRSQKRYEFPPPTPFQPNSEPEPRGAYDLNGGIQALVGTRNPLFGVFAGVHPRAFYGRVGYAGTGGVAVPLMVRLELRPVPRMPIFLSVWAFDLLDEERPLDTYGAHFMYPLARGVWVTAEHSASRGRTQVRGVTDEDKVDAGVQPWTRTWAGFSLGF